MAKNRDNTTTTTLPAGWRTTIGGWVRDPASRRHGLIDLVMLLSTTALIVGLATGALATAVKTLRLRPVASEPLPKPGLLHDLMQRGFPLTGQNQPFST